MNAAVEYKIVTHADALEVVKRMISVSRNGSEVRRAMDAFLGFIRQYHIDVDRQPVALLENQIVGYAMILVNPGAMAGVFLPEQLPELWGRDDLDDRRIRVGLLKLLVDHIDAWDLAIMQTIQNRDEDNSISRIFLEGGFSPLCDLTVMESPVQPARPVLPDDDVEWVAFDETLVPRLEQVVLQSYENSKDCPLLTGLRTGSEVIEGHRWSGIFLPRGWWLMRYRGRDAGVVLLNGSQEEPDRLELIYMGLCPWARGHGLGRSLLGKAFDIAGALGKKTIRLAVDEKNIPAKRLYQETGFREINRQVVLAVLNEKRRQRLREKTTLMCEMERNDGCE